ncbi:uncharacterized protein LOC133299878 [Gastrolobium bilobum]|uniref:uncharacterized protein LOC133299878 n=1 Tax=Gastrolobium bilobum TaxID=150636 RepID=UPI002AAF6A02|nr:uncharacterized protein LOC133299878 [Gastrolobium bilobum]
MRGRTYNPANSNWVSHLSIHYKMHHFLISRLTSRTPNLGVVFFTCRSLSVSNTNHHQGGSFTVSALINSCGLSPEMALKLSKKLQLKNPDGPNAVLDLLRNYGFSQTQLSSLVKKHPLVLFAKPEKTLLPKLKFFHSIGVSTSDLPRIFIINPSFLTKSLKNNIIPRYEIIRSLVRSDKEVVSALKNGAWYFHCCKGISNSVPNIEALRQLGLPQDSISLLVTNFANIAFMNHSRFVEAVETVKEMGFDPLESRFIVALQVLAKINKAMWKFKLEVFERWGWSRDICLLAFKKHPKCMLLSEKKIIKVLNFLVKDMGWPSEDIARCPWILDGSLGKTIIPRCTVVEILKSRGLIKRDLHLSSFLSIDEKRFLKRYVTQFQKNVPHLLDAYEGKCLERNMKGESTKGHNLMLMMMSE